VLGIDISRQAIVVAQKYRDENPYKDTFGRLRYKVADFFSLDEEPETFDAVVFVAALHHLPDADAVCQQSRKLLREGGIVIAAEPARDWMKTPDAAVIALIRVLLSAGNLYFEELAIPQDVDAFRELVEQILHEYKYVDQEDRPVQSPHDNASSFEQMISSLRRHFTELAYEEDNAFIGLVIGGLRADWETNHRLAHFLRLVDDWFVELGIMTPLAFRFAGKKIGV